MQNIEIDRQIVAEDESDIPSQDSLLKWAAAAFAAAGYEKDCALSARFTDPEEVQALNAEYRGKDYPTNILSFPFDMPDDLPEEAFAEAMSSGEYLGDLVICTDVLKKEAEEQGKTLEEHAAHLIVHGCLHLLGFDHISDDEAEEMEALEVKALAALGFDDPYKDDEY